MEYLLLPQVAPFTAALAALVALGALELLSLALLGVAGITHVVDNLVDHEAVADFAGLDWLVVKGVPLMMSVATALGGFACGGFAVQALLGSALKPVSLLPALSVGLVGALASVRLLGVVVQRTKLAFDSTAVSLASLVGLPATLLSPVARRGYPGEAQVRDAHGTVHHVLVQPEAPDAELRSQERIELVAFDGSVFTARAPK